MAAVHHEFMTELFSARALSSGPSAARLTTGAMAARLAESAAKIEQGRSLARYFSAPASIEQLSSDRFVVLDCSWEEGAAGGSWAAKQRKVVIERVGDAWKVSDFHTAGPACDPAASTTLAGDA